MKKIDKQTRKTLVKKHSEEGIAFAEHLVRVGELTVQVRELESKLDELRLERRKAMQAAVDAGSSIYKVAQVADTSQASATRIVRDMR